MNRIIIAFFLIASMAFAGAADAPRVFFVGGGSSIKPEATNVVLEAAYAYTDAAISNTIFYIDWEMGASLANDGAALHPNCPTNQVLASNITLFSVSDDASVKALPLFEVYSPEETPVYVASTEGVKGKNYSLVFTCGTTGQPIDFKLVITLMPYEGVSGTASHMIIFNLRRTF